MRSKFQWLIVAAFFGSFVIIGPASSASVFPHPIASHPRTVTSPRPAAMRPGYRLLKTGHQQKPFANPRNIYADLLVEQAQPYSVGYSFPAGTFDASCGGLAWSVTGGPSNAKLSFSPATTTLTGSASLQIVTSTSTPFGVTTAQITAKCTSTPTTGASAGGLSPTIGIYEYPPDPTSLASQQGMTIAAGTTGYFSLTDAATSRFGALTWQGWSAPGQLAFSSPTTSGPPHDNSLGVSVDASTAAGAYVIETDVYSATSYGESNPISLYINVIPGVSSTVNPFFVNVYPLLKSGTSAPIKLPSTLTAVPDLAAFTAGLISVSATSYSIAVVSEPGCLESRCIEGLINSYVASGPIDLSMLNGYQTVTLANGDTAYVGQGQYRQSTTITWIDQGRRYVIALTVNSFPTDLIGIANSMTQY